MVTVTVMGVLVAIGAPKFGRALEQSRADFAAANLRAIWAAERIYWLENHAYTDRLTQASPKGLYELGLIEPGIVSTSGDYSYTVSSADTNTFQAKAIRAAGTPWVGELTIDQNGTVTGTISASGQASITPGFQ